MEDGPYFAVVCLHLAILSILMTYSSATIARNDVHRKNLPHLQHELQTSFFLSGNAWQPGLNTLLTALMVNVPLMLHINPNFHYVSNQTVRAHLMYRCLPNETDYKMIPLSSQSAGSTNIYCREIRPFKVEALRDQINRYNITLTDQTGHGIGFDQAMTHYLEFKVHVEFFEGETESGSLFVYNLDSLMSSNTNYMAHGIVWRKYILTDEAIHFIAALHNPKAEAIFSIPFLTTTFTDALKKALLVIRSSISISLLLRGKSLCSDVIDTTVNDIIFSSGDPEKNINLQVVTKYLGYIDPFNGILVTSERSLGQARSYLRARFATNPIRACLLISLNWPVWNYRLTPTISDNLTASAFSPSWLVTKGKCLVIGGSGAYAWLTLLTGMRGVVLPNRLVCSAQGYHVATVSYNDMECVNNNLGSPTEWQNCGWYSVHENGNYIRFDETIKLAHSGRYRFANLNKHFTYYITVLTLPLFNIPHQDGALAPRTYANLDTRVSLNCTVHHDGWKHIRLRPVFRVFRLFEDSKWRDLTTDEFTTQILKKRPGSIIRTVEVTRSNSATFTRQHSTSLIIELPHVTMNWRNWLLIFFCNATVAKSDTSVMGLRHYSILSGTDIVFFGIRLRTERNLVANRVTSDWGWLIGLVIVYLIVTSFP